MTQHLLAGLAAFSLFLGPVLAQDEAPERPQVDVVFVLDTTGSMGGLIEGAKQKIWAVVNQIASGEPRPSIRVGLVAYRDKGDEYVTKKVDLTDDLDAMYGELMAFRADGGGDGPEHVNEGLRAGVHDMSWAPGDRVLRIVFLVGDAEPHMDYADDVKYAATCEAAVKAGIIVNTIRCGNDSNTARFWREIANLSEGRFVSIAQDGGVVSIDTPHDARLAELNREINGTFVYFGSEDRRKDSEEKLEESDARAGEAGAPAASSRALYKARMAAEEDSAYTKGDLVTEAGKAGFEWNQVQEQELPEELRKMTVEERQAYVERMAARRAEIQKTIEAVSAERDAFIKDELAKRGQEKTGFDAEVLEIIKGQGAKKGITYRD